MSRQGHNIGRKQRPRTMSRAVRYETCPVRDKISVETDVAIVVCAVRYGIFRPYGTLIFLGYGFLPISGPYGTVVFLLWFFYQYLIPTGSLYLFYDFSATIRSLTGLRK